MTALLCFDPRFRRPLLDLAVAALWADDEVDDREITAARGAQIALGLVAPGDEAAAAIAHGPTDSWKALARAPERERVLAYATAVWVVLADRIVDRRESAFLRELRRALGLDEDAVRFADGLARWVDAIGREEGLPAHRSFARLVLEGARRLERVRARRAEAA